MPMASRQHDIEMFQKGHVQSMFAKTSTVPILTSRPVSEASDMYETEFEEDMSDFEEYSGRRSEDSVRFWYKSRAIFA